MFEKNRESSKNECKMNVYVRLRQNILSESKKIKKIKSYLRKKKEGNNEGNRETVSLGNRETVSLGNRETAVLKIRGKQGNRETAILTIGGKQGNRETRVFLKIWNTE
jgi:hypothetical protein